MTSGFLNR